MSVLWRLRVNETDLAKANRVSERLGTSPQEMVRMFIHQVAESGQVPLSLSVEDELFDVKRRNRILRELDDAEAW